MDELHQDIKDILASQARIEERLIAQAQNLNDHKENTKEVINSLRIEHRLAFDDLKKEIHPVIKTHNGMKAIFAMIVILIPIMMKFV